MTSDQTNVPSQTMPIINPTGKPKSGGTIKFKYNRNIEGWPLLSCTRCQKFFKNHYYVHQCYRLPHIWCYRCLEELGVCQHCGHRYVEKFVPDSTTIFYKTYSLK